MKLDKRYLALGAIACGLVSGLTAHADEANLDTKITFSAPVQIPGMVLAAGTYTFKLADPGGDLSIVEILNANETKAYAMLQTDSAERTKRMGHTEVGLAETGNGNVPVLTEWFYPGLKTGFQFLYPTNVESQLDRAKVQTVIARPAADMEAGE
jgi:hypothetical protein